MKTQELERQYKLRLKFACLNDDGHYYYDASEEYQGFFGELPAGWSLVSEEDIMTRSDNYRHAWNLQHENVQVAAVEHETGMEILVGVAIGVGTEAVLLLTKWAWNKWIEKRKKLGKQEPVLVIEKLVSRSPDGNVTEYSRTEVRLPGSNLGKYIP